MNTGMRNWLNASLLALACCWSVGSAGAQIPGLYKDGILVEAMPGLVPADNQPQALGKVQFANPAGEPSRDTLARTSACRDSAAVVDQIRFLLGRVVAANRAPTAEERQQLAALRDQANAAATRVETALAPVEPARLDVPPDANDATLLALAMQPEIRARQQQSIEEMQRNKQAYLAALDAVVAGQEGASAVAAGLTEKLFPQPAARLPSQPTIMLAAEVEAPRLTREEADALLKSEAPAPFESIQKVPAKTAGEPPQQAPQKAPPVPQANPPAPPENAPPAPADLAETVEIQFTPEITARAAALGNSPLAIYEFVRNKVEFQPYLGSRKGAAFTLSQLHGNDTDQAALLMALLRVSNIPCRYVRGTVEMTPAQATAWLAVDDPGKAGNILTTAGLDGVNIISGAAVTAIRCTRVWVEAYVPYTNYRGIPNDATGKTWIPMDPAYHGTVVTPGEDVLAAMNFDTDTYLADYISTFHAQSPIEKLRADIQTWLDANRPGKTVADIERATSMDSLRLGLLPGSIPGRTLAVASRFSALEESKRYKVRFHLYDGGTTFIDHTLNLSDLASRQLTIDYVGTTSGDQAIIDSHGGIYQTPPNQVSVKPRLKLDGVPLVTSANAIGMGRTHSSDMLFIQPVGDDNSQPSVGNDITAGNTQAIAFNTFFDQGDGFLFGGNAPALSFLEMQLHGTAADYLARVDAGMQQTGRLMRVVTTQDVSEAIVESSVSVTTSWGVPVTFEWTGLTVDADRRIIGTFAVDGDESKEVPFMLLSGYDGSIMENRVFEDIYAQRAISTIKILELSNDANIPVYRITTSIAQDAPGLSQSASIVSAINSALSQGHHVVIPRTPITVGQWQGTGYINLNPTTGAAGYIISGGISGSVSANGGATVDVWPISLGCSPIGMVSGTITPAGFTSGAVLCPDASKITYSVTLEYDCKLNGNVQHRIFGPTPHTVPLTKFAIIEAFGAGEYTISIPGTSVPDVTFTLLDVESLLSDKGVEIDDGDNNPDTIVWIVKRSKNAGDVINVTATPKPALLENRLPGCWSLTGGAGTSKLTRTIDQTIAVSTEIVCKSGEREKKVTIIPLEVEEVVETLEIAGATGYDVDANALMVPMEDTNQIKIKVHGAPASLLGTLRFVANTSGKLTITPETPAGAEQILTLAGTTKALGVKIQLQTGANRIDLFEADVLAKLTKTLEIHAITEGNDDVQAVAVGANPGANQVCVTPGTNGSRDTAPRGDDAVAGNNITTGPDGVCNTPANNQNLVPANVTTKNLLQTYLNDRIWGNQANVHFTVTRTDHVVNYDLDRNGKLADEFAFSATRTEDDAITAAARNTSVDYNVYYVNEHEYPIGITIRDQVFSMGMVAGGNNVPNHTAHEVGHLLGRSGHATKNDCLMYATGLATNPSRILRSEWRTVNP